MLLGSEYVACTLKSPTKLQLCFFLLHYHSSGASVCFVWVFFGENPMHFLFLLLYIFPACKKVHQRYLGAHARCPWDFSQRHDGTSVHRVPAFASTDVQLRCINTAVHTDATRLQCAETSPSLVSGLLPSLFFYFSGTSQKHPILAFCQRKQPF